MSTTPPETTPSGRHLGETDPGTAGSGSYLPPASGEGYSSADEETAERDEPRFAKPGERIGEFVIEALLGHGGMGVVYRATDPKLHRPVAIKRLLRRGFQSKLAVDRFLEEARAIATLNHRHIITIYSCDHDDEGPYIVMEYLPGGNLHARLKMLGAVPLPEAMRILEPVGQALAFAHRKSVTHRDVKPANIIMDSEGEPKLGDFGLARNWRQEDFSTTGKGKGTPAYVSPEQREDAKHVDHRTDIYSLAKTAYHMLTGQVPTVIDLDLVPPAARSVLRRALAERPEDRYFTVDEFINALRHCGGANRAADETSTAAMISAPYFSTHSTATTPPVSDTDGATRTPVDTGFACPTCGTINAERAKFCESCGMGLDAPCPNCRHNSRVTATHCRVCGVHKDRYRRASEALNEARRLLDDHHYDEAAEAAEKGLAFEHVTDDLTEELTDARDHAKLNAQALQHALRSIPDLMRRGRLTEALEQLHKAHALAPERQDVAELYETLPDQIRREQVKHLEQEAFAALETRQVGEAEESLVSLVQMDPNNPHINALRDALTDLRRSFRQRVRSARRLWEKLKFDQAIDAMEALCHEYPARTELRAELERWESFRDELEQLRSAAETAATQNRYARAIDAWHAFLELKPNDAHALKQIDELAEQMRANRPVYTRPVFAIILALVLLLVFAGLGGYWLNWQVQRPIKQAAASLDEAQIILKGSPDADDLYAAEAKLDEAEQAIGSIVGWQSERRDELRSRMHELRLGLHMTRAGREPLTDDVNINVAARRYATVIDYAQQHGLALAEPRELMQRWARRARELLDAGDYLRALTLYQRAGEAIGKPRLFANEINDIEEQHKDLLAALRTLRTARELAMDAYEEHKTSDEELAKLPSWQSAESAIEKARAAADDKHIDSLQQAIARWEQARTLIEQAASDRRQYVQQRDRAQSLQKQAAALLDTLTESDARAAAPEAWTQLQAGSQRAVALMEDRQFDKAIDQWQQVSTHAQSIAQTVEQYHQAVAAQRTYQQQRTQMEKSLKAKYDELTALEAASVPAVASMLKHEQAAQSAMSSRHFSAARKQYQQASALVDDATQNADRALFKMHGGINSVGMTMVAIALPDGGAILAGRTEVTRGQYAEFVKAMSGRDAFKQIKGAADAHWREPAKGNDKLQGFAQDDSHPVVNISYEEAVLFCQWLSEKEGVTYRLPTTAQWEAAAGMDADHTQFHWIGKITADRPLANTGDRALKQHKAAAFWLGAGQPFPWHDGYIFTAPVGKFPANQHGLHDIHGNVGEWTRDKGPGDSTRIVRGGSWASGVEQARFRPGIAQPESTRDARTGFRVIVEAKPSE